MKQLTSIIDTVIGFLGGLDWGQIGRSITSYISGALSEATDWLNNTDFAALTQSFIDDLSELFRNVDWGKLARDILSFLGAALKAANDVLKTILDNVMDGVFDALFGDDTWVRFKNWFINGWNGIIDSIKQNTTVMNIFDFFGINIDSLKFDPIEVPVTANITDRKIAPGFDSTIYGMTSQFGYKSLASGYDPTIYGMTSQFRYRNFAGGYVDTVYGMTSQFRYKTVSSNFPSTITGMTASFSNAIIGGVKYYGSSIVRAMGGAFYGGSWHDIPQYASGGAPGHGSLFVAGEAGPEIVGHIGGRTEVLNASQIASAIAAGVSNATYTNSDGGIDENALYNVFVRALNDSADSGDIYLDGEAIYRSVRKHNDMNTRMTGVNAFA